MNHFERPPIVPYIVKDQDVALNVDAEREAAFWSSRERVDAAPDEVEVWSPNSKHQPFERHPSFGGEQLVFRFPNGYGASLINSTMSYGNEIAVARFDGDNCDDWVIDYDTPITDGVLGYLTLAQVEDSLDLIAGLPCRPAEVNR